MFSSVRGVFRHIIAGVTLSVFLAGPGWGVSSETELEARPVSADSIALEWSGGTRVSLERKEGDGTFEAVAVLDADRQTHLDRGLAEGTAYTYRLRAVVDGRYDFGPAGSPAEGHIRVRLADRYTPQKGYGIVPDPESPPGGERNRGGRAKPRLATLVYRSPRLTFAKDLPDGEYLVSLASGDAQYEGSASVALNGREIVSLTDTEPGKFVAVEDHPVRVSDGRLIVEIGGHGRLNYVAVERCATESPLLAEARAETFSLTASPGETTYYVDPARGEDANLGTAPGQAWKTLARINALKLAPGDRVLLRAGGDFTGPLVLQGSGAEGQPIVVDRFGEGANPVVHGEGNVENTIRLHNGQYWEIGNLTITNTDGGGWDDVGRTIRRAVYITAEDAGDLRHIHLKHLEIRDVRGMYRFAGHQTNGGIICRVLGDRQPTRFVDLRIEGCTFRTASIDRYPVIVTSSWGKEQPSEVVWKDNTLDHAGRAHIVIPAEHWPREKVYYYDPEANAVFALDKYAPPISPLTGRVGCEDVFSEIAARLRRSWSFFEATRVEPGRWLFANEPGGTVRLGVRTSPTYPLAYYGELRTQGFLPPWLDPADENLRQREDALLEQWVEELVKVGVEREEDWTVRNRAFMNESKWMHVRTDQEFVRAISQYGVDPDLTTREKALAYFQSLPWQSNPYGACNFMGKALHNYRWGRIAEGEDPEDDIYYYVKELIDSQYQRGQGYWGGQRANHITRTNGNMKMLTTYAALDWEIPQPKQIVDFTLSGADERMGFRGSGCSAFNQMFSLAAIRRKYPELADYRGEEIDRYTAMTFMTWLATWNESTNFYGNTWLGKHNNGVALFMPTLLLDQPYMRSSTICNWREGPIITRKADGGIKRNPVIYQRQGFPYDGGG